MGRLENAAFRVAGGRASASPQCSTMAFWGLADARPPATRLFTTSPNLMTPLEILYEDNHLLVVNKPAGIATMGAESGPTVHCDGGGIPKKAYNKPGRAFVGVVSRLDSMTTGVLVLARTSKAASRLSTQFANKSDANLSKIYLAAVAGQLDPPQGELVDFVRKDDAARRMRVVASSVAGAQRADLRYITVAARDDISLLAVQLLSGRKHQIRRSTGGPWKRRHRGSEVWIETRFSRWGCPPQLASSD